MGGKAGSFLNPHSVSLERAALLVARSVPKCARSLLFNAPKP
jgi:hypothetical protein